MNVERIKGLAQALLGGGKGPVAMDESNGICDRRFAAARIIPGIKVDIGARHLASHPGETVTEGLDGLRERLAQYVAPGARYAKWRAVIGLGAGLPTAGCIAAHAHALARYPALSQEAGLVPVVEPEVLMDGDHDLERCRVVNAKVLHWYFDQFYGHGVLGQEPSHSGLRVVARRNATVSGPLHGLRPSSAPAVSIAGIVPQSLDLDAGQPDIEHHAMYR